MSEAKWVALIIYQSDQIVKNPGWVVKIVNRVVNSVNKYINAFSFNRYPSEDAHISIRFLIKRGKEKKVKRKIEKLMPDVHYSWQPYNERESIVTGSAIASKLALKLWALDFDTALSLVHSLMDNLGFNEKRAYTKLLVGTQYAELKEKGEVSCDYSTCPNCKRCNVFRKEDRCCECGAEIEVYSMKLRKEVS